MPPLLSTDIRPRPPTAERRRRLQPAHPIQPGQLGPARRRSPGGWRSDGQPRTDTEQLARVMLLGSVALAATAVGTAFVAAAMRAGMSGLAAVAVAAPVPAAGLTWAVGLARFRPVRPPTMLLPRPEPGPLADPNPGPVAPWRWSGPHSGSHQQSQRVTQSSRWWRWTVRNGASAASRRAG